ncbi:NDP-sugar synthase [Chloroflexota bacterium]
MKAMILAAGLDEGLRPLTIEVPKVLFPINRIPAIEHIILWLKSYNISEIAINVHHLKEQILDYLDNCGLPDVNIKYSVEENLLGTACGVNKMASFLGDDFVVVCGDIYTDFNLAEMIAFHKDRKAVATLAIHRTDKPWLSGIVNINDDGLITSFVEKPAAGTETGKLASGGVYILNKQVLSYVSVEKGCDFGSDVFPELVEMKQPVYGYRLKKEDYLVDIGTFENYINVNERLKKKAS